jgi:hypothetical protein
MQSLLYGAWFSRSTKKTIANMSISIYLGLPMPSCNRVRGLGGEDGAVRAGGVEAVLTGDVGDPAGVEDPAGAGADADPPGAGAEVGPPAGAVGLPAGAVGPPDSSGDAAGAGAEAASVSPAAAAVGNVATPGWVSPDGEHAPAVSGSDPELNAP